MGNDQIISVRINNLPHLLPIVAVTNDPHPCFCCILSILLYISSKQIWEHFLHTIGVEPTKPLLEAIELAFMQEHAAPCSWYRLTAFYVAARYKRWMAAETNSTTLKDVNYWSSRPCNVGSPLLKTTFQTYMTALGHQKFPMVEDWDVIVDQAWVTFCSKFVVEPKVVTQRDVLDLLHEDMEEGLSFLSFKNQSLHASIHDDANKATHGSTGRNMDFFFCIGHVLVICSYCMCDDCRSCGFFGPTSILGCREGGSCSLLQ
jgi:hypothetical protein